MKAVTDSEQFVDVVSDFDGGRAFVQAPLQCEYCGGYYPVANCLLSCYEDGNVPITSSFDITKAKENIEEINSYVPKTFENKLDFQHKKDEREVHVLQVLW